MKSKPQSPIKGQVVHNVRGDSHVVDKVEWKSRNGSPNSGQWRIWVNGNDYSRAAFNQYFKA